MATTIEGVSKDIPPRELVREGASPANVLDHILHSLSEAKAEDITTIDLAGKTSFGDYMVIASGRSDRHVGAITDQLLRQLKNVGVKGVCVEGTPQCDWVLVDAGDIIVHVFRPEVRSFYNLERMWQADRPDHPQSN